MTETSRPAPGPSAAPSLAVQLAEQFKAFGVAKAFGEPVRLGDETVVPVAVVQYGFGGGGGHHDGAAAESGGVRQEGGGGGGVIVPVGVLARNRDGRAVFRPNPVAVLACLVPVLWAGGHAVSRVVRTFRS
ncbi:spore germination protein GerW family protein [Arthrobacter mobilis]|uniref:Sporulation protein YtfJ (Spore_YtfJ) n=1 Tax=Arthrobacter mobilis TaxID=2724944 RepID=A0A7X6H9Z0_9MICC|nr:spore germination protein GerW family protein [Arthrobacter mobilis]NKX53176.1 hypothetical protein [Arthrobacter mobilis]